MAITQVTIPFHLSNTLLPQTIWIAGTHTPPSVHRYIVEYPLLLLTLLPFLWYISTKLLRFHVFGYVSLVCYSCYSVTS